MQIIGKIQNYVFHNEDNSYSIAKLKTDSNVVTITGYFPKISDELEYEFTGNWITHGTYGEQFKVESFKKMNVQNKVGLINYLSSNRFTGIGPKTAEKIFDLFGQNAIRIIIEDKDLLSRIGLTKVRSAKFYQQLLDNQNEEDILIELYNYGLTSKMAMKLLNKYQGLTLTKLNSNPYRLIDDIDGVGFMKADEIAKKLGLKEDDNKRLKAAIIYTLQVIAYQSGDIYLTESQLKEQCYRILKLEIELNLAIEELLSEGKLIIEENRFYLSIAYYSEIAIANKIMGIMEYKIDTVDLEKIEMLVDVVQEKKSITYTDMQNNAIVSALSNKISVITGGPGTGKTTIIDGILETYKILNKLDYTKSSIYEHIALMAPTGRAAKRMRDLLNLNAQTIHRQLGYSFEGEFVHDSENLLPNKLIIIDESSMIDIYLAKKLFDAIKLDAQVIIVGDEDQLPSVGPGQFLADIIKSNVVPVIRLNQIHRQAADSSIIKIAKLINEQKLDKADLHSNNDLVLYQSSPYDVKNILIDQIKGAIKKGYSLLDDVQILIPMYKGINGIDEVNRAIQNEFNQNTVEKLIFMDKTYYKGDKVIQLVNNPTRNVMNGDTGIITDVKTDSKNEKYLLVRFDENEITYHKEELEELNLAYAISIHKSQGSEYKIVFMPILREHLHMLRKELIYTAITRAKSLLLIIGDMSLLMYASNHLSEKRQTTLASRLTNKDEDETSPYDYM